MQYCNLFWNYKLSTLAPQFESSCGILFRGIVTAVSGCSTLRSFGSKKEILEPNSQESNIM